MPLVGITYDLRSEYLAAGFSEEETGEFDRDETIDAIESTLQSLNYRTERIGNIRQLTELLASGHRWDIVFNIAEGMYGIGRETQVPALLDAYQVPYTFSDPLVLALSLHKGMTKKVLRDSGIPTAGFFLIENKADILNNPVPYPVFVKPVAEGTGKGIDSCSKVENANELEKVCSHLLDKYQQAVLVEEFLPGREFTVGITGTGKEAVSLGALEIILKTDAGKNTYSFINKEKCEEFVIYRAPEDPDALKCQAIALDAWRCLGCRDGGRVDLKLDAQGNPKVLELNPLAGLHPEHSDLPILVNLKGISYLELISRIMESAMKRYQNLKI
ncbi:MAG: D-alanine--D-alanine ligase [Bacteroidia bacterium]|nr:D-alanine--D-alanine ligase [Bacteroidia bacterium]